MKTNVKIISLLIALMLIFSAFSPLINNVSAAEERTTGTLTINKTDRNLKPIQDVEFTIYKVEDDADPEDLTIPQWYTDNPNVANAQTHYTAKLKTNSEGQVRFEGLPLGRYLVLETDGPEVVIRTANFFVDVPMTNPDGQTLNYDVVATPKNDIVSGTLIVEKQDLKTSEVMSGVIFKLQKLNESNGTYEDYRTPLQTGENGQVQWPELPVGTYKLIEVETKEGYVFDKSSEIIFKVFLNEDYGTSMKFLDAEGNEGEDVPDKVIIKNEKPDFEKEIESQQANKVTFKVTTDVPTVVDQLESFNIIDTMQNGLKYIENTLQFKDIDLKKDVDYSLTVEDDSRTLRINFTEVGRQKLEEQLYKDNKEEIKTLTMVYSADIMPGTDLEYKNEVYLAYGNYEAEPKDEDVIAGGFKIKKINKEGQTLAGAKFKIALTKQDAKNSNYIKDRDGNDIVLTSAEGTGLAEYYGLVYGKYYLVEIEAPLDENGNRYNLLREPVEFTIDANSYNEENTIEIKNNKGLILPFTGGIGPVIMIGAGIILVVVLIKMRKRDKEVEAK